MIPIQLELRNFMSYGEVHEPLCLDGIHVACLTGPNGHGKSTLLDAMVWALWGEPRGGARAGDDLIRHGASEMMVSFEFEAGGTRYRTLRRRSKHTRAGSTELHFESWNGESWRSLDGGTTAETQRIIGSTLHMTHGTFVHASFIAQGKADAFMALTPQQRKQVLGEILDLAQYDLLAEAAREARRAADAQANQYNLQIQQIDAELAKRTAYEEQVRAAERVEEEAKTLTERLAEARQLLVDEVNQLQGAEKRATEKAEELRRVEDQIRSWEGQLRDLHARIEEARGLVERAPAIERDFEAHQRLNAEEHDLGSRFQPWNDARDELNTVRAAIDRERAGLEAQLRAVGQTVAEHEARLAAGPRLQQQVDELHAQIAELEKVADKVTTSQQQQDEVTQHLAILRQDGERLKEEVERAQQRRTLLGESDTCPLCGQVLGTDGLVAAQQRLDHECDDTQRRLTETRTAYQTRLADAKRLQEGVKVLQESLAVRPRAERALGELEAKLAQIKKDERTLAVAHKETAGLTLALANDDFAAEQRALLEPLRARMEAVGYDPERHRVVRAERDGLGEAPEQMQRLGSARATLETAETHRVGLDVQLNTARQDRERLHAELDALQTEAARLPKARSALADKENELQQAAGLARRATIELGQARQQVNWLQGQEQDRQRLILQRKDILGDVSAYSQLAEAFGKNGIQEMIIEQALPQIEDVANELLNRLTDGRMRVEVKTQREGRGGGTISTLDVYVADELGRRPYELFSGGEKFRINFAIRIALSRLLAHRAGVPLQMLAIDEGFGSQDRDGCDRLVEAIKEVQDDFARVLVITHLDELRDAFPVHIEVTKTLEGSTFTIT